MTEDQKQEILRLRNQGLTFTEVAEKLELNRNTVKTFVSRYEKKLSLKGKCLNCGGEIEQKPKTKTKKFCCDKCRNYYWNHYQSKHIKPGAYAPLRMEPVAADSPLAARIEVGCSLNRSQFQRESEYGVALYIWEEALAQGIIDGRDFKKIGKMYSDRYRPLFHLVASIDDADTRSKTPH